MASEREPRARTSASSGERDVEEREAGAARGGLTRRELLAAAAAAGATFALPRRGAGLVPIVGFDNPLGTTPERDWEAVYRDQYRYDRTFTWVCAPNDTHMCRMRAFVRNGVLIRSEQNYDVDRYGDPYGNRSTVNWHPRGCHKGYTFQRRVYGPYRLAGPALRAGWKQWADDGFPSLSDRPELRTEYRFDDRGRDGFVRVSWEEAARYLARGLAAISRSYSGDEGRRRLLADGYDPDMLEHWRGAGTSTVKMGSNLPLHGLVGKFGIYRLCNQLGLLDHHVRGVPPEEAVGGRAWNEYTWRGDQAPGTPFATGLQTSDMDFNDLRFSKLILMVGKNLVENKMPESHWFIEAMERGARIVNVAPEYAAPSAKSDYWIGVRPGLSDLALLLGVARILIDREWYDSDFVRRFTDLPLLVRTDTLKRLRPEEVIPGYAPKDLREGPSYTIQGLTDEQRAKIGDFCLWDETAQRVAAVSRDEVGEKLTARPALDGTFEVETVSGERVEVMPILEMYRRHLRDYDLETVAEITGADPALVERLAKDLGTIKPAAIHFGEGVNHYFHATLHNRACFLLMALTGNIGRHGAGVYAWAGNYKGALFQAGPWAGPGVGVYVNEDPFAPVTDETAALDHHHLRHCATHEEPSYWGYGERILKATTPQGEVRLTGDTHLPTPTKAIWYNNANFLNQAKWIYELIVNVLPKIDLIVDQQIEWTGSAEYADVVLPVNSWAEFEDLEVGGSCSNPFLQVWGGDGIRPVHDTVDDAMAFALVAEALAEETGDPRFAELWTFVRQKRAGVYIQRVLDACITTRAEDGPYRLEKILAGEYGEPGAALFLFRTYPRVPFWEQVHDSIPFYTDCGRLAAYCDLDTALRMGENLVVHREGVEATPYLPNVIVSSSEYVRPEDYGIPREEMDPDLRSMRNLKLPWSEVKKTTNPLFAAGYRFFCSTPKSRHTTHSSWSTVDWNWIWSTNFGDPFRRDRRMPGVGDRQIQMSPQAAEELGLADGDYVWVDANPADRPYRGWSEGDGFRARAFRCMVRLKINPALPPGFTIMKHTGWIASERSVEAHETRADGRALAADTGYQASYRYGSHQSITRGWLPPMHQTDALFHKKTGGMGFVFGFDVDNHAVNTVPKETLVRITRAEPGGIGGEGVWRPATTAWGPTGETEVNRRYLAGELTTVGAAEEDVDDFFS